MHLLLAVIILKAPAYYTLGRAYHQSHERSKARRSITTALIASFTVDLVLIGITLNHFIQHPHL